MGIKKANSNIYQYLSSLSLPVFLSFLSLYLSPLFPISLSPYTQDKDINDPLPSLLSQ